MCYARSLKSLRSKSIFFKKKKRDTNLIFFLFVHIARISKEIGTIPPWKDSNATQSSWPYPSDSINLSNLQALKQNYH
jgi:hypothetical protein